MIQDAVAPDSLRQVLDSIFAQARFEWAEKPELFGWFQRLWRWLVDGLDLFREASPIAYRAFLAGMIVLLALIVLHSVWVFWRTVRRSPGRADVPGTLPDEPRSAEWYHLEGERLAARGLFRDAIMTAWRALELSLVDAGAISYQPGSTPREHAVAARLAAAQKGALQKLVSRMYQLVFGAGTTGPDDYQEWVAAARALEHEI